MTSPIPAAGYPSNTSRTQADMQTYFETMLSIAKEELGGTGEAASVQLASNTFTPGNNACFCPIDTNAGGPTDTLNTIQTTNIRDGEVIFIRSINNAHVITVANAAGGSGEIFTADGNNIVLNSTKLFVALKYNLAITAFEELFRTSATPNLSSPGPIGNTTPNTGEFTTLTLTGSVAAHKWLGNNTSSSAAPSFQSITSGDLPATTVNTVGNLSPIFSAAVSAQALNFTLTNASAGSLFGNFGSAAAAPAYNAPGSADQVLGVAHTAGGIEYKTIAAGSGITITPTAGTITISATGGGGFTNPMTTLGDAIYGATGGTATRLAGNTTTTKKFLSQTGTGSASAAPVWNAILPADVPIVTCGGRCYLISASPWADGSSSGNTTIYFGPANSIMGNLITIGSTLQTFSETSLTIVATASTAYYIYVTSTSGTTVAMGLLAWTNQTTPSTTYTQNGQLYADSAFTKLIVGGFNCRVSNTVFNWSGERALSNYFNQIQVPLLAQDNTASWSTTSSTSVAANGSTANGVGQVQVFNCVLREPVRVSNFSSGSNSTLYDGCNISIALNGTTVAASQVTASQLRAAMQCSYCVAQLGLSTWARQNLAAGGGTATYYGATNGFMGGTCFA